ncbi:ABC-2 type transport system permease protein [Evansella caseinilytica]|uniref:ABC-2 type transport system permease protein n=1 Tax=Evansella caseinilytica TaxID=1503961 RepID=A0A1H3THD7_9BACI|nr:ABC transporter permease subunit [Evansella caseinilytica]SDZ49231.1 ABC-2 type transport system permease protein [Evansella caseinilytica]
MRQWFILFKKECLESVRNFKWLWIPIVFILFGIMQPVTSYYLPQILESFGGLPEEALFDIPVPSGPQILAETLGQFSQIGYLVLVLAFMGVIAEEKNSGTQLMILVKPVSYGAYLTAKWAHMSLLAVTSFILGFSFAVYYTHVLIESVPAAHVIKGAVVYILGMLFVMTLILLFSTLFNSRAAVAFLTLGLTIVVSLLSSLMPNTMRWSPGMLSSHAYSIFGTGEGGEAMWLSIACTLLIISVMVGIAVYIFRNKETASHSS